MLLKKLAVFLLLPLYAYAQVSGTTKVTVPSSGIPSNAIFVFTGISINDDDNHASCAEHYCDKLVAEWICSFVRQLRYQQLHGGRLG